MEQDHTGSRKRTNGLNVPANESQCYCPCHDDHSREHDPRSSKRQKPERRLRVPSQLEAPVGSIDNSLLNVHQHSFDIHTQTNTDINAFGDGFSVFPPVPSPDLQPYLSIDGQHFPQDAGAANNTAETSASSTVTNDTFSPRSLNRQVVLDTNDCAIQNPNAANEPLYDGLDGFSVDLGVDWQWDISNGNLLTFSGPVSFDTPFVPDSITDVNNNSVSSFSDRFPEYHPGRAASPFMPATVNELIAHPDDPPWVFPRAFGNWNSNHSNGELPRQRGMSAEILQPAVLQTPKLQVLQPSKRSSTTSSTLAYSNTTSGEQFVQHLVVHKPVVKLLPRSGVRKGPLKPDNAEHARVMRKRRSCWSCRLVKFKCSLHDPCNRCTKLSLPQPQSPSPSPSHHILCHRARLADYTDAFFPDLVISRLSEEAIAAVMRENADFTDNKFEVEMSSGPDYPLICLTATEFKPLKRGFLALKYVAPNKNTDDQLQTFSTSYAPPIGLHGVGPVDLRKICLNHIKSIIDRERSVGEADRGDTSTISWKTFEAVNRYRRSNPENGDSGTLLRRAVMLHAMNYFMSRIITITRTSAEKVVGRLRRPRLFPFEQASQILTSTLLNLQIKQAMQNILRDMTRTVLKGLEKQMLIIPKTKDTWADNFCVVLILCMCLEAVEVASDSYAMAALRRDPSCTLSRIDICRALDDEPFRQLTDLFRTAYKTTRAKANQKGTLGFNPIRHGLPINVGEGITPQMGILVNEVKQIMIVHGAEMAEAAKNPSFDDPKSDLLTHHMAFRKKNSGRLVSIFLMSLMQ